MPKLMGVDIPGKKQVRYALRYIHGIGPAVRTKSSGPAK